MCHCPLCHCPRTSSCGACGGTAWCPRNPPHPNRLRRCDGCCCSCCTACARAALPYSGRGQDPGAQEAPGSAETSLRNVSAVFHVPYAMQSSEHVQCSAKRRQRTVLHVDSNSNSVLAVCRRRTGSRRCMRSTTRTSQAGFMTGS